MSVVVNLTWSEVLMYANLGIMRRVKARTSGQKDRYGAPNKDPLLMDVRSVLSEAAVAKYFGVYYHPHTDPGNQDVTGVEVRSTVRRDGRLLLHEADAPNIPHVLAVGSEHEWTLCGWILPKDGRRPEWWMEDWARPCYAVPQSALSEMELLKKTDG